MQATTVAPPVRTAGAAQAWVSILVSLLPMMAIVALMPALPTLLAHFRGVPHSELLVPMIVTAPGVCIALIAPFAGAIIDKYGRRKLLILFLILYGLGGIVPFFIDGFEAVIASRLILGIGEGFVMVLGNVLLADYFAVEQRAKWLTIQGVFGSVAGTVLLILSGHLSTYGWNYPFLVYGLALLMAVGAYFLVFEPGRRVAGPAANAAVAEPAASAFPWSAVGLLFIITFCTSTIYFVYNVHFSLALDELGVKDKEQLGNLSALASIAVPVGALLFRLVSKRPFWQQLALIGTLFTVGLLGIGRAGSPGMAVAAAVVMQLGCGMTVPTLTCWALNLLPAQFRGRGMGFWSSGFFMGQFLNPLIVSGARTVAGSLLAAFTLLGFVCLALTIVLVAANVLSKRPRLAAA